MTTKTHPDAEYLYVPVPSAIADLLDQAVQEKLQPSSIDVDFIHFRERAFRFGTGKETEIRRETEVSYGIMGAILHVLGYSDQQLLNEVDEDGFLAALNQRGIQADEDIINVLCYWFANIYPDFAEMAKLIRERDGDVPLPKYRKATPLSRTRVNG